MNVRIRTVRETAGESQEAFSKKLGMSENYVWMLEKGRRVPSERTIKAICQIYNINESWLRTGEGDMMVESQREDIFAGALGDVSKLPPGDFKRRFFELMLTLEPEDWENVEKYIDKLLELKKAPEE